jgi:hypothetical protein
MRPSAHVRDASAWPVVPLILDVNLFWTFMCRTLSPSSKGGAPHAGATATGPVLR